MRLPDHFGRTLVIALTLLSAGFFGAYLRFLPYLEREATYTDGKQSLELSDVDRLRFAVWDDPLPLSPTVNTTADESSAVISPDRDPPVRGRFFMTTPAPAGGDGGEWGLAVLGVGGEAGGLGAELAEAALGEFAVGGLVWCQPIPLHNCSVDTE